jgi:hypothetical protein
MLMQLFEPFREWVRKTRRRKGSKKPSGVCDLEGARVGCGGSFHRSPSSLVSLRSCGSGKQGAAEARIKFNRLG